MQGRRYRLKKVVIWHLLYLFVHVHVQVLKCGRETNLLKQLCKEKAEEEGSHTGWRENCIFIEVTHLVLLYTSFTIKEGQAFKRKS